MKIEPVEDDVEEILARRLDEYCRQQESRADLPEVPSAIDQDLPVDLQERFHRARMIADQLARLSMTHTDELNALPMEARSLVGQLFGRFEILAVRGIGGFGVVYRAYDPRTQREVALKVPRTEFVLSSGARQRFLREARAVAKLDHPNIAAVMESGEIDGIPFIVSNYCAGQTLADWMKAFPQGVPWRQAVAITLALADAVAHAHERGVLHRDVKPSNVLLMPPAGPATETTDALPFLPRLTDFGLAKLTESSFDRTRTGALLGTVRYMAPEQAAGRVRDISTASDIYSLGMVFYELLTGRTAFHDETDFAVLTRIQTEDAIPVRKRRPGLPRDVDAVCLKCLEKNPMHRYRSAGDLVQDLQRTLLGEPTVARPLSRTEFLSRYARRRPAAAGLLILTLIFFLTTSIGGTWYSYKLASSLRQTEAARSRAVASEQRAEHLLYAADMKLASESLARGDTLQVRHLLDRHIPTGSATDQRTFLWHYLAKSVHREPVEQIAAGGQIYCQANASKDKILVTGDSRGMLSYFFTSPYRIMKSVQTGQSEVNAVAISRDSKLIASGGKDGTVKLWQSQSDSPLFQINACKKGEVYCVAFDRDAKTLITAGDDSTIRFWRVSDGTLAHEIQQPDSRWMESVSVAPDGKLAIFVDDEGFYLLIDLQSYALITRRGFAQMSHAYASFSPDGQRIAIAGTGSAVAILRRDGTEEQSIELNPHHKQAMTWSSDGSRLFVGDRSGSIHVLEMKKRHVVNPKEPVAPDVMTPSFQEFRPSLVESWKAHQGRVWSLSYDAKRNLLRSTGEDGHLKLWESKHQTLWKEIGIPDEMEHIVDIRFLKDHMLCVTPDLSALLDFETHAVRYRQKHLQSGNNSVAVSADGNRFVHVHSIDKWRPDMDMAIYDTKNLKVLGRGVIPSSNLEVTSALSHDGKHAAIDFGLTTKQLQLFELPTFKKVASRQFEHLRLMLPTTLTIADQECYLILNESEMVAIRHPDLVEVARQTAHATGIHHAVVSPDGKDLYTIGRDGLVKAWDRHSLQLKTVFAGEHVSGSFLVVSPDGHTLLSAPRPSGDMRLWDVRTAQQVMTLEPPTPNQVYFATFSPDGSRLYLCYGFKCPAMYIDVTIPHRPAASTSEIIH